MKQSTRVSRLALTGEVVRRLSTGELAGVAGGAYTYVYTCACPTLGVCPGGPHTTA